MSKLKKLVVTVAALAALAVGGAAFAQAQNASTPITSPTHQSVSEEVSPGDTDGHGSASGQNEETDPASKADAPDGPTETADQGSQED
jgi:hypothetical protein